MNLKSWRLMLTLWSFLGIWDWQYTLVCECWIIFWFLWFLFFLVTLWSFEFKLFWLSDIALRIWFSLTIASIAHILRLFLIKSWCFNLLILNFCVLAWRICTSLLKFLNMFVVLFCYDFFIHFVDLVSFKIFIFFLLFALLTTHSSFWDKYISINKNSLKYCFPNFKSLTFCLYLISLHYW